MAEANRIDHDQPGGVRGTHLEEGEHGITNKPKEESERQTKVVQPPEMQTERGGGKGA